MKEQGFTLVEILVAVTITGIVLVSVFSLLQRSFQLWDTVGANNHWEQNFRVLETELKRDLHNLFVSPLAKENLFEGSSQKLEFYKLNNNGKMTKITYYFDDYNNKFTKKISYPKQDKKARTIEFFSQMKIKRVEFQFYDREAEYLKSYWSQQEIKKEVIEERGPEQLKKFLPQAVKLEIELEKVNLPPLVIENFIGREYGGE
ncbi:PulJ/GspJ family protein [Sporohalobacter salinus]|uniref:PulJ/GspJ family protein n=1 Tax=Sporohalobacter salinus TaxID=1494606 RepID=UPI0019611110|nr:prepilin-type N-terminal cleavage/methylation domain-containing protein [Sporohalobacter salinus]MBM7623786.1 general secretion pathway protein J [Sporohalobacter salinus]